MRAMMSRLPNAFFEWLAKELDKTVPPEGEVQKRKRAVTNKRVQCQTQGNRLAIEIPELPGRLRRIDQ